MRLGLSLPDGGKQVLGRWLGEVRRHQLDRPLQQEAGGISVAIPDDLAAVRIGRVPGDSRHQQGGAVDPGRVNVEGVQVDGQGLDPVQAPALRAF
jgi:hypothetical protein